MDKFEIPPNIVDGKEYTQQWFTRKEVVALVNEVAEKYSSLQAAYDEWIDKTQFVQDWQNEGTLPIGYLGLHRADILRHLAERLMLCQKISSVP